MKKCFRMKFWDVLFIGAMITSLMSSCGDDEFSNSNMEGIWKCVSSTEIVYKKDDSGQWVKHHEDEDTYGDNEGSYGFLFHSDGKAQLLMDIKSDGSYNLETKHEFKFKVENDHLYLDDLDDRDTDGWEDWGKISKTGNIFELISEEIEKGLKEVEISKYKKI